MATQNDSGFITLTAGAALEAYRLVAISAAGTVTYAAADSINAIGVTQHEAANGDLVTIKLLTAPGTFMISAADAVAAGAALYVAGAAGQVDDTGTTGIAMEALAAAGATGDVIECAVVIGND